MLEVALTALALSLIQEAEDDPWIEIDGEWQRTFNCTVDTNREFRMRGREREPAFRLDEGDGFRLTVRDHDDGFRGISVSPPEGVEGNATQTDVCSMEADGPMFRCNLSLRPGQVIDYYGSLEEHRFTIMVMDDAIGQASEYGSDPSSMDIQVSSGVCLD